jgi:uncharacterized protein
MPDSRSTSLRTDPRRPFLVDLRDIGRRPGTSRVLATSVPAPAGMKLELIGVPAGEPVDLDLQFESVVEGIWVSGNAAAEVIGECSRCLQPLREHTAADVQELYAYPDSTTEASSDEDEVRRLDGDFLDLEPAVRDALLVDLPLRPLCRPDCAGLCSGCGERFDDLPEGHSHETIDPRWAALTERISISSPDPVSSGSAVPDSASSDSASPEES